ncbi:L-threonylcarbamoyladenylate synthase [Cucumibacter marinus]|uniref:L-threonylcarbamoyladenylate synthase n=1 Tax=Cucumibacter marinus TaxID=1121252 RepID=UPI000420C4D6|nr:L-threonylcarbamoyladenylate synthase [Cucumibacter marinus]
MNTPVTASPEVTLDRAASILRQGGIVAMPTETVYGLAADAANDDAVLRLYETKGRPRFNPLIAHCADLEMAQGIAEFPPLALKLAEAFWPGPLTLVLPRRADAALSDLVTAGLPTIGLRVPDHPVAQELIARVGMPLAAPSANPSGRLSPTTADAVIEGFDGQVPVLDGGPCHSGVESTIIAVDGDMLVQLRPGAIAREEIAKVTGFAPRDADPEGGIRSPGMLASHYAPRASMRLNAENVGPGEVLLAFGAEAPAHDGPILNLSQTGDLAEAARNLFAHLRALDASGADKIAVMPIPDRGLGEAINDRLRRAAAPRG